jgi:hypothetical protein
MNGSYFAKVNMKEYLLAYEVIDKGYEMLRKIMKKSFFISLFFMVFTNSVFANEVVGAAIVLFFPLYATILSYGIALVLVILVEGFIIKKWLATTHRNALKISLKANLYSTIIGIGIGFIASLGILFFIGWIFLTFLFVRWLNYIVERTGYLKKPKWVLIICCSIVGYFTVGVSMSLENRIDILHLFTIFRDIKTTIILSALFVFGFIISFVSESYVIIRMIKDNNPKVVPAVFRMNIVSYLILIVFTIIRSLII